MPLNGWKRLAGSAERYRNPEGKVVSRRQYENARSRKAGWESWSEYQRERKTDNYNRLLNRTIEKRQLTRRDIGPRSEFSRKYLTARKARSDSVADLYDPEGPLARFLIYVGLREPDDWWDVGDTPQGEQR